MPIDEQLDMLADRYRLDRVIGRGGMADVYHATDELLEREVAVKVLRARTATERDRARFETEARTVAQFDHPHLVTLLDAGIDDETPYLVMDLVEGPSLAAACADGPLPRARVAAIGAALCHALTYVHGHDVVHRDLKPGNVLLGDDGRVRLADFGIARLLGDTAGHTATGTLIGTAAYLAPEQVRGEPVSPASDVYSLGLLLLEAMTGTRAYTGTPTEAALARLHTPPALPDDLPDPWVSLLRAMTSLEPAERPEASAVGTALTEMARRDDPSFIPAVAPPVAAEGTSTFPAPAPEVHAPPPSRRAYDAPDVPDRPHEKARPAEDTDRPTRRRPSLLVSLVVIGVVAAVVLGVMVVTMVHGGAPTPVPGNTPADLRGPLSDLHAAVAG
ncbi:MAG: protein kinase domain-containing protein [Nocardioidaceae bacterium]